MNINLKLDTQKFCYVYRNFKIEEINNRRYIIPEENATRSPITISEHIENILIDILNIGKKAFFNEEINDLEILEFANHYGLLGFMSDFPVNRYYILDNEVVLRDYNFVDFKDSISIFNIQEYMKIFLPKLNTEEINKIIEKCKKDFTPSVMEKYLTTGLNKHLLYSEHYAEPIDMIIQYAHLLYKTLYYLIKDKYRSDILPILSVNNITHSPFTLFSGQFEIKINYLKQAIDLFYSLQISQEVRLLKICNFCNKAFIATNPKAEYHTYNCKNKANVYKSRSKNMVSTRDGIAIKITQSQELSDALIKGLKKKNK